MNPNEYLTKILSQQRFADGAPELNEIREKREEIAAVLRRLFPTPKPSIRWAGSMAKGTMIRESYDGDMTCYFAHDASEAGETLAEIYKNTEKALSGSFGVEQKQSAIRVRDRASQTDLHIDVVPGRYTGEQKTDVFLHRTTGDKQRLKTNLQAHIDHIKNSGVVDAIRLIKLWNVRNGVGAKTFALELLVVKLLKDMTDASLSNQLLQVWTEFRDNGENLAVDDPANSNNDLKSILDASRLMLTQVAENTLWQIENNGWKAVFGNVEEDDGGDRGAALRAAAASVSNPTRPWLDKGA